MIFVFYRTVNPDPRNGAQTRTFLKIALSLPQKYDMLMERANWRGRFEIFDVF